MSQTLINVYFSIFCFIMHCTVNMFCIVSVNLMHPYGNYCICISSYIDNCKYFSELSWASSFLTNFDNG